MSRTFRQARIMISGFNFWNKIFWIWGVVCAMGMSCAHSWRGRTFSGPISWTWVTGGGNSGSFGGQAIGLWVDCGGSIFLPIVRPGRCLTKRSSCYDIWLIEQVYWAGHSVWRKVSPNQTAGQDINCVSDPTVFGARKDSPGFYVIEGTLDWWFLVPEIDFARAELVFQHRPCEKGDRPHSCPYSMEAHAELSCL